MTRPGERASTSADRTGRAAAEAGFTLVEMLVALALLSMVALAIIRFQTVQLVGSGWAARAAVADVVAENAAVDALLSPAAPAPGVATQRVANAGRDWLVTTRAAPAGEELLRLDIAVESDGRTLARRTLLKAAA